MADASRTLAIWVYKGSHRIDKNKDGNYDEERAVQIIDAWWPRAVEAMFKPALGTDLFDKIVGHGSGSTTIPTTTAPTSAARSRTAGTAT